MATFPGVDDVMTTITEAGIAKSIDQAPVPVGRAWYAVGVLTLVMLLASVDRQVLVLLGEPVRIALRMSDFQLGMLQGPPAALLIIAATYPIAWLVDRMDRRWVLVGCIAVWSVAVVACGLAQGFTSLFIAAALVGIGEAGIGPLTIAFIPDLFARKSWQGANSVFQLASTTSGVLALAICGQLTVLAAFLLARLSSLSGFDVWRITFFLAALPAPLMILLLATLPALRSRPAPAGPVAASRDTEISLGIFIKEHRGAFVRLFGAFGLSNLGYSGLLTWLVILMMRDYGQSPAQVGASMSIAGITALPIGLAGSILLTRLFAARVGPAFPIIVCGAVLALSACVLATLAWVTTVHQIYAILFVGYALNTTSGMLLPTAMQTIVPAGSRARLAGLQIMTAGLIAPLGGPLVGLLSDRLGHQHGMLQLSITAVASPSLLAGGLLLWLNRDRFTRAADHAATLAAT